MSEYEIPVTGEVNDYTVPLHGHLDVAVREYPVIPNPEGEPTEDITKMEIDSVIYGVKDAGVHDWARAAEKPTYTKAEIGLGEVDNTSDLNKPISTATQASLDTKVDKIAGKGLSANDYTNEAKAIVDSTPANLATKVNKVNGKGLSTNDYTDSDKAIVAGVTSALASKVDKEEGKGLSEENYTAEEKTKLAGNGNLLQYSCLKNSMERGIWRATVCGVAKSQTQLSDLTSLHFRVCCIRSLS